MDDLIIEIEKLEEKLMQIREERKKAEQPEETVEQYGFLVFYDMYIY